MKTKQKSPFGSLCFWSWNGDLQEERVRNSIRRLNDQGFAGFFMHARAGLITEYLSDDWFKACRVAVEEASILGMTAWIYDEDGWPSGFGGGRISGLGELYQGKYFKYAFSFDDIPQGGTILSAFQKDGEKWYRVDNCEADLFFYYLVEPNYVDLLSTVVTEEFIKHIHEKYKLELGEYFGSVIPGIFTDEPQFHAKDFPYSFELPDYFSKKFDYDFIDNMYRFLPGSDSKADKQFRLDYWTTVEEMMRSNFSKKIYDWCEENNLLFTGHYPGEDSLIQQIVSTAGVTPKYEFMQLPGIDHLGRRITPPLLTKQVTSVAKQFDRKRVLSETFGCSGWDVTLAKLAHIWGYQAAAGVNLPCFHLTPLSILGRRKRDYPAFFSYHTNWWNYAHLLTNWMQNLNVLLSEGDWTEDVLVVSPMSSIMVSHNNDSAYEEMIAASYRKLLEGLEHIQIGYDIGDEILMRRHGKVVGKHYVLGSRMYSTIILAKTDSLNTETIEQLEEFQNSGGEIICIEENPILKHNIASSLVELPVVQNRPSFLYKYFAYFGHKRLISVLDKSVFKYANNLRVTVKRLAKDSMRIFIWNKQEDAVRNLVIEGPGGYVFYEVDLNSGERRKQTTWQTSKHSYTEITVHRTQMLMYDVEPGQAYQQNNYIENSSDLRLDSERLHPNSFTIDYASFIALRDGSESNIMSVTKLQEVMYKGIDADTEVILRYRFKSNLTDASSLLVNVESDHCFKVVCNDEPVSRANNDWFIDQDIYSYAIGNQVKIGWNIIDVYYQVPAPQNDNADGLFETEVNRFYYPFEPESIYITGDFDVESASGFEKRPNHLRVVSADFSLVDEIEKSTDREFTHQGLWFYRGDIKLKTQIDYIEGEIAELSFRGVKAALIIVGTSQGTKEVFLEPYVVDITSLLSQGKNDLWIILVGTNRNVLGPHHHQNGEMYYTGPNSFTGTYGYEDFIVNHDIKRGSETWSNDYSFVEFGISGVTYHRKRAIED